MNYEKAKYRVIRRIIISKLIVIGISILISREIGGYIKPFVYGHLAYYAIFWGWWAVIRNPFIEDSGPKTIVGLIKDLKEETARVQFMVTWDNNKDYLFYLEDTLGDNAEKFVTDMKVAREAIGGLEEHFSSNTYVRRTFSMDSVYEHYLFILYNLEVFIKYEKYIELYLFDALIEKLDQYNKIQNKPKSERNIVDVRLQQELSNIIGEILCEIDFGTKVIMEHLRDEPIVANMNELQENIEYVLLTKKHGYKPL